MHVKWIMTLFAALVVVGCATSPPREVVQSNEEPTQAMFRLDTAAVGSVPLEVRVDPGMDSPFQIPARVTYVPAGSETWTAGLAAVLGAITNGSTGGTPIDALLLGPAITEQLQMVDFFERFESAPVESIVEINGESTIVSMTVFNTDNLAEGFLASFNVIRNEIVPARACKQIYRRFVRLNDRGCGLCRVKRLKQCQCLILLVL